MNVEAFNDIKIERLPLDDPLKGAFTLDILQDKYGFLWFATDRGLVRYNGYNFHIYKNQVQDTTSLSSNHVLSLFEDNSGSIWAGTLIHGLNRLDRTTGKFIRYVGKRDTSTTNPYELGANQILDIYEDSQNNFWVGTTLGLLRLEKGKYKKFLPDNENPNSISEGPVTCVHEDSRGRLWIGTNSGLNLYDRKQNKFSYFDNASMTRLQKAINCMTEDRKGNLWIGTYDGLIRFNPETKTFKIFRQEPENSQGLNNNVIWDIQEVRSGQLWIGTEGGGVNILNPKTNVFSYVKHDPEDPYSLNSDYVTAIYEDRTGIIWIGTGSMWGRAKGKGFGINKYDPDKKQFHNISINPFYTDSTVYIDAYSVLVDHLGVLWIGTNGQGLISYDESTDEYNRYLHDPSDESTISENGIMGMYEDKAGKLWFGTWNSGLNLFNRETKSFRRYQHDPNDPLSISSNRINEMLEDSKGRFWIATFYGGLNLFDRENDTFRHYVRNPQDPNSISTNQTSRLFEDHFGNLWISTWSGGLNKFNFEENKFVRFMHDPKDPKSISHNIVRTVVEDETYDLWVATAGGLNKFSRSTGTFNCITEKDGLLNNQISGILKDDSGSLWIQARYGISRFNPTTQKIKNYDTNDGLVNSAYLSGPPYKNKAGEMFFPGRSGVDFFHPDSIKDNPHIPPIVITRLTKYNSEVKKNEPLIIDDFSGKKSLFLTYKDRILNFEFAALNYRNPAKNQYAYKLDGFNDSWIQLGTKHDVTFTDLSPGNYTLHVRGSNNDGVWNMEGTSLEIYIAPPWWRTYWAYGLYFAIVLAALLSIRAYELKRQRLKYDLKMEHEQAETLKELDRMKSRFFASISHEFRTPLTLISGPVERLLKKGRADQIKDLKRIQSNAGQMDKLVKMYLELSKLESGKLVLHREKCELISLLKIVLAAFESRAEAENKNLRFKTDLARAMGQVDKDMFALIMNNLLSNAFKFTAENGEIEVSAQLKPGATEKEKKDHIEIAVKDSGIGIAPEQQQRIFEMYFQVDNEINKRISGTGIGLAMVKELVEMHEGELALESTPGRGSRFSIVLPIMEAQKQSGIAEALEEKPSLSEKEQSDISTEQSTQPRILIVEDNHQMLDYIKSHLEEKYKTQSASDGRRGFEKALKFNPQLIVSDVMMPEMDGFEFCARLKQDFRTSHIPVILLTAKIQEQDMYKGLETGADTYITKPFKARELLIRIGNLIENRQRLHKKFLTEKHVDFGEINITSADQRFLEHCRRVVETHLSDEDFTVDAFAKEVAFSRVQLHRKLNALTGLSASAFIKTMRLKKAAILLKSGFGNIAQVAFEVGFSNPSHFSSAFKKMYAMAPSDYVRKG